MRSILFRIETLELKQRKNPLIVLACTSSGEMVRVTMQECLQRALSFQRVIDGDSLTDLDLLLKSIRDAAKKGMEK